MEHTKKQMSEAAFLYYKKKLTQQEIASIMHISRQTVSKLLNDAINERIVEISVHDPEDDCTKLEKELCRKYGLKKALVCSVSNRDEVLRRTVTVKRAIGYLTPFFVQGNKSIAISLGRTIEEFIDTFDFITTNGNVIYPLFGETDTERLYFSSNELAHNLACKLSSKVKNTWFPYLPASDEDTALFRKTSYYKTMSELWSKIDIAVVGIGNTDMLDVFEKIFGKKGDDTKVVGDIATHFFTKDGTFVPMYENSLCASVDDLKNAGLTVALACGDKKTDAIRGALLTNVIDVLVTDEYTALNVLEYEYNLIL